MVPATAVASAVALVRGPGGKPMPLAPAAGDAPFAAGDRLTGSYTCTQGRTELTLVIEDVRGDDVSVVFEFAYRGATPGHAAASGRYRMQGTLDRKTGKLDLEAGDWIEQPNGYVTVDLEGTIATDASGLQTYKGRVIPPPGGGCTTFHVTRRAVIPSR